MKPGFTLIEILITLFIIALTATFALPAFKNMYVAAQSASLRDQVNDAFLFAAQEANARQQPIALQLTSTRELTVFINDSHEVLRTVTASTQQGYMIARIFPKTQSYFLINPSDEMLDHDGTLIHCGSDAAPDWAIMVSIAGQARVALPNAEGNIIDSHGKIMTC
jgi:prepilin-type N-terminal cleavage/methylation domain-containing protein